MGSYIAPRKRKMDTMIPKSVGQDITDNETEAKKSKQEI